MKKVQKSEKMYQKTKRFKNTSKSDKELLGYLLV